MAVGDLLANLSSLSVSTLSDETLLWDVDGLFLFGEDGDLSEEYAMDRLEDVPEGPLLEVHGDLFRLYGVGVLKEDLLLGEYALPIGAFDLLENFVP